MRAVRASVWRHRVQGNEHGNVVRLGTKATTEALRPYPLVYGFVEKDGRLWTVKLGFFRSELQGSIPLSRHTDKMGGTRLYLPMAYHPRDIPTGPWTGTMTESHDEVGNPQAMVTLQKVKYGHPV